jgi:hypothetical protein
MGEVTLGVLVAVLLVVAVWKATPADPCGYLRRHPPAEAAAAAFVQCR